MIHQLLTSMPTASDAIQFNNLGLSPVLFEWGWFQLRWYSLAYLFGIIIGWWYLLKLIRQPGAPMARRHADDMAFYTTLGIILGGRLGYVLFYKPGEYFQNPAEIFRLWDGGMSFHGGVIGVSLGIIYLAWRNKLDWLRIHDYVACCIPPGLFLGRLANFVNGELWGGPTSLPWGMIPPGGSVPVHPSQLYEAALEGLFLMALLVWMFWKTRARYQPGKLVGTFILVYGLVRFGLEFIRLPDAHLVDFAQKTGLHMGQWLSLPMILGGIYLVATAKKREGRVQPLPAEPAADDEPQSA